MRIHFPLTPWTASSRILKWYYSKPRQVINTTLAPLLINSGHLWCQIFIAHFEASSKSEISSKVCNRFLACSAQKSSQAPPCGGKKPKKNFGGGFFWFFFWGINSQKRVAKCLFLLTLFYPHDLCIWCKSLKTEQCDRLINIVLAFWECQELISMILVRDQNIVFILIKSTMIVF